MTFTIRLALCAGLAALSLGNGALLADGTAPVMNPIAFSGRWDLRAHDRAITVNSGSYLRSAFSGTSIDANFDLSVNAAFFYAGCPRDDSQPDLVVINQGTNEHALPTDQYLPLYMKYLALVRQAYSKARIAAAQPFNGSQADSIKQAFDQVRAKGGTAVQYIDTTGWYTGTELHPLAQFSVPLAEKMTVALKVSALSP